MKYIKINMNSYNERKKLSKLQNDNWKILYIKPSLIQLYKRS